MDKASIQVQLQKLNGWNYNESRQSIEKEFTFKSYMKTISFVNAIAWIANKLNHHPDLQVSFSKCIVVITTHDKAALTEKDFQLAFEIENL